MCLYVGHVGGKLGLHNWSICVSLFSHFIKLFSCGCG